MRAISRRQFVLASAATCVAPSLGFAQSTKLATTPTVDSLTVKVVTDSSYDTPRIANSKWVRVKRASITSVFDPLKTLHSQWGLALVLESKSGDDTRTLMLDYGYTPEALLNNMAVMGIDPKVVQGMVLSHGHFDHFGGLVGLLKRHRSSLPNELTLYVGGEDNFCNRKAATNVPGHFTDWGILDRRELAAMNVKLVMCEQPTVVNGHAFTTGHIARRSFERVLPNTPVEYGTKNGLGCNLPAEEAKAGGKPVQDQHLHEHGTCFVIKDRGLVVISSCGHAGIVNTVQQAIEASGVKKVHAIMGGFHLFPADAQYIGRTISELKALNPDVMVPMHCSGPEFVTAVREQMADRFVGSTTGTELTFGV